MNIVTYVIFAEMAQALHRIHSSKPNHQPKE